MKEPSRAMGRSSSPGAQEAVVEAEGGGHGGAASGPGTGHTRLGIVFVRAYPRRVRASLNRGTCRRLALPGMNLRHSSPNRYPTKALAPRTRLSMVLGV